MFAWTLELTMAFNLVCSGTVRTGQLGIALPEASGDPISVTYRIDLDTRRWCSDACEATEPFETIEGTVVLRDLHYPAGSHVIMIGPNEGRFSDSLTVWNRVTLRSGTCVRAPFTGFLPPGAIV